MAQSFSIPQERCAPPLDPALQDEIQAHTADEVATSRILRSIERFGVDPSIERYEMTPQTQARTARSKEMLAWTVRAVRAPRPDAQP